MGWDKNRRYYSRSRKVNGRVVREYIGSGVVAELSAQLDALNRQKREAERDALRHAKAEVDDLGALLNEVNELADLLVRATLLAANYRQHKRGEWRKKRDNRK